MNKAGLMTGVAITAGLAAGGAAAQQAQPQLPTSVARAAYFKAHPEERAALLAGLARPEGRSVAAPRLVSTTGGSWSTVATAPVSGLCNPLLLTDGTVMVASCNTPSWYKLTPDSSGDYAKGKWSKLAALPKIGGVQYEPQYHASGVLPDGRVIIMGGEYNGSGSEVWTNLGAIYDPVANSWTAVTAPAGTSWKQIGDASSVVLANGTFMLSSCCAYPDANALLNATTLTWTTTGAPVGGTPPNNEAYQDEQGYELLSTGDVLTVDIWTDYANKGNAKNAELYSPSAGTWSPTGNTPVSLPDPYTCGNFEIGPAVTRSNGTVVAFGGNTGCAAPTADPTAIYSTTTGTWKRGANVPATCGTGGTTSCTLADAPAALLPNGNVLFAASAGYAQTPTHFFEFSTTGKISQVSDTVDNAGGSSSYYYNFLVLPTGQVFTTDFSSIAELYTPTGAPLTGLAPIVRSVGKTLVHAKTYKIAGKQMAGRSQGAFYGDDDQSASNYPLVRITNTGTGHVFYARTTGFSSTSIAKNTASTASFTVPAGIETGASTLSVVANGIASAGTAVTIE